MPKEFRSVGPGGGLVTHDVPGPCRTGLPQTHLRQPGSGAPWTGGGGDRVRKPHCVGAGGQGYRVPRQSGKSAAAHAHSGGRFLADLEVSRYCSVSKKVFRIAIEAPNMNRKKFIDLEKSVSTHVMKTEFKPVPAVKKKRVRGFIGISYG